MQWPNLATLLDRGQENLETENERREKKALTQRENICNEQTQRNHKERQRNDAFSL